MRRNIKSGSGSAVDFRVEQFEPRQLMSSSLSGVGPTLVEGENGRADGAVVVDLDGDGRKDVVSLVGRSVMWTRGLGGARFAEARVLATLEREGGQLAGRDINGDGRVDLAILQVISSEANQPLSEATLLIQGSGGTNGAVNFNTTKFQMPSAARGLLVEDFVAGSRPEILILGRRDGWDELTLYTFGPNGVRNWGEMAVGQRLSLPALSVGGGRNFVFGAQGLLSSGLIGESNTLVHSSIVRSGRGFALNVISTSQAKGFAERVAMGDVSGEGIPDVVYTISSTRFEPTRPDVTQSRITRFQTYLALGTVFEQGGRFVTRDEAIDDREFQTFLKGRANAGLMPNYETTTRVVAGVAAIVDLNSDGRLDIAVSSSQASETVRMSDEGPSGGMMLTTRDRISRGELVQILNRTGDGAKPVFETRLTHIFQERAGYVVGTGPAVMGRGLPIGFVFADARSAGRTDVLVLNAPVEGGIAGVQLLANTAAAKRPRIVGQSFLSGLRSDDKEYYTTVGTVLAVSTTTQTFEVARGRKVERVELILDRNRNGIVDDADLIIGDMVENVGANPSDGSYQSFDATVTAVPAWGTGPTQILIRAVDSQGTVSVARPLQVFATRPMA